MRRTAPSRSSPANAGWGCQQIGTFRELAPPNFRRLTWLSPGLLLKSRNDLLAEANRGRRPASTTKHRPARSSRTSS